jgi:hypothetical protein
MAPDTTSAPTGRPGEVIPRSGDGVQTLLTNATMSAVGGPVLNKIVGRAASRFVKAEGSEIGQAAQRSTVRRVVRETASEIPKAKTPYKRPSGATTSEQRAAVQGKPCVKCGEAAPKMVAGHKKLW